MSFAMSAARPRKPGRFEGDAEETPAPTKNTSLSELNARSSSCGSEIPPACHALVKILLLLLLIRLLRVLLPLVWRCLQPKCMPQGSAYRWHSCDVSFVAAACYPGVAACGLNAVNLAGLPPAWSHQQSKPMLRPSSAAKISVFRLMPLFYSRVVFDFLPHSLI